MKNIIINFHTICCLLSQIREDLNLRAPRVIAVLHPLKLVINNYPEDMVEEIKAENNPKDPDAGRRKVPCSYDPETRSGRTASQRKKQ